MVQTKFNDTEMRKFNIFCALLMIAIFYCSGISATGLIGVKHVFVASGGAFTDPDNKVKLYRYDSQTREVELFDSIPGRFTREIVVDDRSAYISVDSMLYKYDVNTLERKDSIVVSGINRMAIHKNFLIITRWFPATANYIEIYNKNDFSLLYKDTNVNAFTKGIAIHKDTAYIAVTAFDSGKVAVISLANASPSFIKEINLDTTAKGMEDIFTDGKKIYTLSYPYGTSYNALTSYDLTNGALTHDVMPKAMEGVGFRNGMLYANFGNGLQAYNTTTQTLGKVVNSMNYYRGIYDSIDSWFYLIDNNFTGNNKIYILSEDGETMDTFEVGMSTEAIAFHYADITSVSEPATVNQKITVYPNPATSVINIVFEKAGNCVISLKDITGKTILEKQSNLTSGAIESINVENLPKGIYILQLTSGSDITVSKIIIE